MVYLMEAHQGWLNPCVVYDMRTGEVYTYHVMLGKEPDRATGILTSFTGPNWRCVAQVPSTALLWFRYTNRLTVPEQAIREQIMFMPVEQQGRVLQAYREYLEDWHVKPTDEMPYAVWRRGEKVAAER